MKSNTFWWRLLHLDPVLFRTVAVTLVALLASLGILVTPAISDNLVAVVMAVSALAGALWARDGVTPNDKVVVYKPDPVGQPSALLPGAATAEASSDNAIVTAARAAPIG
jgi:hypothetical protein